MMSIFIASMAFAYNFGDNWAFNWCTKCGKYFKHVGIDILKDNNGKTMKAGQKVTFTEDMKFRAKGSDGNWKEWLVAKDSKNTYTYVVFHLSGIPSFKQGDSLKNKFIGYVADLSAAQTAAHVHVGYRNAPYDSKMSMKGALPACNHNKPKYSSGKDLPQFKGKFDVPYIKVKITN
jgi:hypothetical protein